MIREQRHEANRKKGLLLDTAVPPRDKRDSLIILGAERNDHESARGKLIDEAFGNFGRSGRYDDPVEKTKIGPTLGSVSMNCGDVFDSKFFKALDRAPM